MTIQRGRRIRGGWCWRCDHQEAVDPGLIEASLEDPALLGAILDEEAVLHVAGASWLGGDHRGREAYLRIVGHLADATVERHVGEVLVGSRYAVVVLRIGLSFGEGELITECAHLLRLEGGRIREGWMLFERPAAVDEVLGLPHRSRRSSSGRPG